MGTLSRLGLKAHPDTRDEIPKTAPLWKSRPDEPWKRSSAPSEVWIGVNMSAALVNAGVKSKPWQEESLGESLNLGARLELDFGGLNG